MDLDELRRNWEAFGRDRPFWAILTDKPDWDEAEFFETGRAVVAGLLERAEADGLAGKRGRALDFGCGAGRLSRALSAHYEEVVGVDVAESMIELARRLNRGEPRCRFVHNERGDLSAFEDASFDLVLTLITLQHMRPDYAKGYIREFLRLLRPGGVLVMQVPSARIPKPKDARLGRRIARFAERLVPRGLRERRHDRRRARRAAEQSGPRMEMYPIPEAEVRALLESGGARVVRAEAEPMSDRWVSVVYTAERRSAP